MIVSTNVQGSSGEDPKKARQMMAAVMGPGHVDQSVRVAIHHCWMMLPEEKKNAAELEAQMRRILERALLDFQEDLKAFDVSTG